MAATADELTDATADEIRDAIEQKRGEISAELDALGDRLSPRQVVKRARRDTFIVARHGWNRVVQACAADALPSADAPSRLDLVEGRRPTLPPHLEARPAEVFLDERGALRLALAMLVSGFVIGRLIGRRRRRR